MLKAMYIYHQLPKLLPVTQLLAHRIHGTVCQVAACQWHDGSKLLLKRNLLPARASSNLLHPDDRRLQSVPYMYIEAR